MYAASYDEAEHPRDERGRWTDTGGGALAIETREPTEPEEAVAVGRLAVVVNEDGKGIAQMGATHPALYADLEHEPGHPWVRVGLMPPDGDYAPYVTVVHSTPSDPRMASIVIEVLDRYHPSPVQLEWISPYGALQTRDFESWQEAKLWLQSKRSVEPKRYTEEEARRKWAAEWDEAQHPRDAQGQFTETEGTPLDIAELPATGGLFDQRTAYVIDAHGKGIAQRGGVHGDLYTPLKARGGTPKDAHLRIGVNVPKEVVPGETLPPKSVDIEVIGPVATTADAAAAFLERYRPAGQVQVDYGVDYSKREWQEPITKRFESWQEAALWFTAKAGIRPPTPITEEEARKKWAAEWEEGKHPRDEQGRFSETEGAPSASPEAPVQLHITELENADPEMAFRKRMSFLLLPDGRGLQQRGGMHANLLLGLGQSGSLDREPYVRGAYFTSDTGQKRSFMLDLSNAPIKDLAPVALAALAHYAPTGPIELVAHPRAAEDVGKLRVGGPAELVKSFESRAEAELYLRTQLTRDTPKPLTVEEARKKWAAEADFDESKHPRDARGRFSETEGKSSSDDSDELAAPVYQPEGFDPPDPGEGGSSGIGFVTGDGRVPYVSSNYSHDELVHEALHEDPTSTGGIRIYREDSGEVAINFLPGGVTSAAFRALEWWLDVYTHEGDTYWIDTSRGLGPSVNIKTTSKDKALRLVLKHGRGRTDVTAEWDEDKHPRDEAGRFAETKDDAAIEQRLQRGEFSRAALREEYDRIVSKLTEAYQHASETEQSRLTSLDDEFHRFLDPTFTPTGVPDAATAALPPADPVPFIRWARSVEPDAFAPERIQRAERPHVTPVEDIGWLPEPLYHGTGDVAAVLQDGMYVHAAEDLDRDPEMVSWSTRRQLADRFGSRDLGEDVGSVAWGPYVVAWYRGLSPSAKAKLKEQVGNFKSPRELGSRIGLVWTHGNPRVARQYAADKTGAVLALDPKQMSILGAFTAEEEKREIVLVVPANAYVTDRRSVTRVLTKKELASAAEWDEEKHPRDEQGKWTESGGKLWDFGDQSLRDVLDNATEPAEIAAALEHFGARKVTFEGSDRAPVWVHDKHVIEWDGKDTYPSVTRAEDWIADADLSDEMGRAEDQFHDDFWSSPPPLYHATTEDHAEDIDREGLGARDETRGLANRSTGAAVFTTSEADEAAEGSYGDIVYVIDTAAMKRDGLTPRVAQEEPEVEAELRESLAHELGFEDYSADRESGISPFTTVIFGDIPPKYLRRLNRAELRGEADWDEEKHPRDERGRFVDTGEWTTTGRVTPPQLRSRLAKRAVQSLSQGMTGPGSESLALLFSVDVDAEARLCDDFNLDTVTPKMRTAAAQEIIRYTQQALAERGFPEEFTVYRAGPLHGEEAVPVTTRSAKAQEIGRGWRDSSAPTQRPAVAYRVRREDVLADINALSENAGYIDEEELLVRSSALRPLDVRAATEPTPAQAEAGNYPKRHVTVHGLDVSIETEAGQMRHSTTLKDGKPVWSQRLRHAYGYVRGTVGKDGDHVDVFLSSRPASSVHAFIINQATPGGTFDEHKVMLGWPTQESAVKAYLANYPPGQEHRILSVRSMGVRTLKTWLEHGDTTLAASADALDALPAGARVGPWFKHAGVWWQGARLVASAALAAEWEEDKHPRDAHGRFSDGTVTADGHTFVRPPEASSDDVRVDLDVAAVDRSWQRDEGFYIGPGGTGHAIGTRYQRFGEFVKEGRPIQGAVVALGPLGELRFVNGRHRVAYLRDHGQRTMPFWVPKADAEKIRRRFGAQRTLTAAEFDEAKHPRDEHGRWTDAGGTERTLEITTLPPRATGDNDIAVVVDEHGRGVEQYRGKHLDMLDRLGVTYEPPLPWPPWLRVVLQPPERKGRGIVSVGIQNGTLVAMAPLAVAVLERYQPKADLISIEWPSGDPPPGDVPREKVFETWQQAVGWLRQRFVIEPVEPISEEEARKKWAAEADFDESKHPRDAQGRFSETEGDEEPGPRAPSGDGPPEGYVRIYRGVNPERNEIAREDDTHGYWYTTTYDDAVRYANWDRESDGLAPGAAVLAVDIPRDQLREFADSGSRHQVDDDELDEAARGERAVELFVDEDTARTAAVIEGDPEVGRAGQPPARRAQPRQTKEERIRLADEYARAKGWKAEKTITAASLDAIALGSQLGPWTRTATGWQCGDRHVVSELLAAEWDEEQHPRDERGRFTARDAREAQPPAFGDRAWAEGYVYHTTTHAALDGIRRHGLRPATGEAQHIGGYGAHSKGRIFYADEPESARSWFSHLGTLYEAASDRPREQTPVLLRVAEEHAGPRTPDPEAKGFGVSSYSAQAVAPRHVEFWDGQAWRRLTDRQVTQRSELPPPVERRHYAVRKDETGTITELQGPFATEHEAQRRMGAWRTELLTKHESIRGIGMAQLTDAQVPEHFKHLLADLKSAAEFDESKHPRDERGRFSETEGERSAAPIETPAFKAWFKESQVVDEDGQPLRVYHATAADFAVFDPAHAESLGMHFGTVEQANKVAESRRGPILPVYLQIEHPLRLPRDLVFTDPTEVIPELRKLGALTRADERSLKPLLDAVEETGANAPWDDDSAYVAARKDVMRATETLLQAHGYDGLIYPNAFEGSGLSYAVFRPEQIKSAIGNRGTFDPKDPDISAAEFDESKHPRDEHGRFAETETERGAHEAQVRLSTLTGREWTVTVSEDPLAIRAAHTLADVLTEMRAQGYRMPRMITVDRRPGGVVRGNTTLGRLVGVPPWVTISLPSELPVDVDLDAAVAVAFGERVTAPDGTMVDRFAVRTFRDVIVHEMCHAQQPRSSGLGVSLSEKERHAAWSVSKYATTDVAEFKAECFVRLMRGETLSPDAQAAYTALRGPRVRRRSRAETP